MNNITNKHQLEEIRKIVESRKNENNPHNDTYIRRLSYYPQYLLMDYWINAYEISYVVDSPYIKGKILDFGCGSGHIDILLARKGKDIHGMDLSSIAIDIANYMKSYENEDIKNRVSFSLEDICSEPGIYHEFDSCVSTHVFEHIPNVEPIITGLKKRVKPGSHMIILVPLGYAYNDPDHIHHFMNENELRNHFSPYVNVISTGTDHKFQLLKACLQF